MTDHERSRRIAELFEGALDLPEAERAAWVTAACGDDQALRGEVLSLLAADAAAEAGPTLTPGADLLADALAEGAPDRWIGAILGAWTLESLLGEGGMGRVYRARRSEGGFEQSAAIKLLRTAVAGSETLERFARERATLARLEHPGIARLLDGGSTDDGVPWLAMELVEGESLDSYCDGRRLSVEQRVNLAAKVCDAVAFAHRQLVVHRDLKPSNVLVDAEGNPRLLDFGIAKVLDEQPGPGVTSEAGAPRTPGYASPEQLRGEPVGTASDVFSLGVLLHELLTGVSPHQPANDTLAALLTAVCVTAPTRPSRAAPLGAAARGTTVERLRRRLAGDLDNVVMKSLAREPERRYPSAADLADDLRRHLAGLPVGARAPTLAYRTSRFVARHRAACVLGGALLLVALASAYSALESLRRDRDQLLDIRRLSDARRVAALREAADGPLWPPTPDLRPALDAWLADADALLAGHAEHAATLDALHAQVAAGARDDEVLWWRDQLSALVSELDAFAAPDPWGTTLEAVRRRRALVDELERVSLIDAADAWSRAQHAVGRSPRYDFLQLSPQWGLVPWREDPATGLWWFWLAGSGAPPSVDAQGRLLVSDDSALVFVLLPAAWLLMGAQADDPALPGFDDQANADEGPVQELQLSPFFVALTEVTQGQWLRLSGANPSNHQPPAFDVFPVALSHPVEQVSYDEAVAVLSRAGLALPTEAQWEHATRAGTDTPWYSGPQPTGLDRVANLADLFARDHHGSSGWNYEPAAQFGLDDGATIHAPVASYAPNPFGLHDVHGNVWEWTADQPAPYWLETAAGSGARVIPEGAPDGDKRVLRGGAFSNPPDRLRSAKRWSAVTGFRSGVVGLRPVRRLSP